MPETPKRSRPGKKESMPVTVRIPTQLRELSGGASEVTADGGTVASVLAELEASHPGFGARLFDDGGQLRRFVNVFVADEDIRFLDGVNTPVAEGQTVSIVPAVAGG
jgi:sulfur-carrier protein